MCGRIAKKAVCLLLTLSQVGCQRVYRFQCTSYPSEAGVVVMEEMVGETECLVEIPADSEWIQDGKIEFTFCLPDGREKTKIVDLHGFKPSNPAAEIVAAPFWLVGAGLLVLASDDDEDDDDNDSWPAHFRAKDKDRKDCGDRITTGLVGVGILAIGAGLHTLLGGDADSLSPYEVHVDFSEPQDTK